MSRQTKFMIALAIAFASITVMSVLADTIYLPVVYRQPTPTATNTPTPTARPPGVYIDNFHPSSNPQDDYLTIINTTDNKVDFTDWFIKTEKSDTFLGSKYEFKDCEWGGNNACQLGSDKSGRVYSGIGTDSPTVLYWGLNYSLWTYPTNCAYLRDDDSELIHKWCVESEWD